MIVKELMKKLEKCDPNAMVMIFNTDTYISGMYKATDIEVDADGVEILTDYAKLLWEEDR